MGADTGRRLRGATLTLVDELSDLEMFIHRVERIRLLAMRAVASVSSSPASAVDRIEAELERLQGTLSSATTVGRDRRLAARLELDDDALGFLWFAVALASDPLLLPQAVALGGPDAKRGATIGLYAEVVDLATSSARRLALSLDAAHPLRRHALLVPVDVEPGAVTVPWRAPRRVAAYLGGSDAVDDLFRGIGGRVEVPTTIVRDADSDTVERRIGRVLGNQEPAVIILEGPDGVGRRTLVARAAGQLGRQVVALDVRCPANLTELESALAALRRELALTEAIPVVVGVEALAEAVDGPARVQALHRFLEDAPTVVLATEGGLTLRTGRAIVRVPVPIPTAPVRRSLWAAAAGEGEEDALDGVAERYRLGAGAIGAAVRAARAAACARDSEMRACDLGAGVRAVVGQSLGDLAARLEVAHTWVDVVISEDVREQIDLVRARARYAYHVMENWGLRSCAPRGGGLAVLLSGPPGTGKTMIAGLLARDLDLELYQVDLSRVVSKWLGETEKNLSRLFSAADAGHALLLFDEADALFARRTEVRGSNDRYANLEVNHLLQRIEAFGGVAVLTTNLESSLDPALRRRLAAHIQISRPAREEREALWRRLLASGAPIAPDVDCARLADDFPDLAGGDIRNAVLSAAYLAAAEGTCVTASHLQRAAWNEYRSMRRVLVERKESSWARPR